MTQARHTPQQLPSGEHATADALPDPARLMARLDHMEALLRAHQGHLRSRLDALRDELAHAGLDAPQLVDAAGAPGATGVQANPAGRPCRPRIDRTV